MSVRIGYLAPRPARRGRGLAKKSSENDVYVIKPLLITRFQTIKTLLSAFDHRFWENVFSLSLITWIVSLPGGDTDAGF